MIEEAIKDRAFDIYYALGGERSYRKVAEQLGVAHTTINLLAKDRNWEARVKKLDAGEEVVESDKYALTQYTGESKAVDDLIHKVVSSLDQLFVEKGDVSLSTFAIVGAKDFKSVVGALKDLIMIRERLAAEAGKEKGKPDKVADTLNIYLDGATPEQKMDLLKTGKVPDGSVDTREVQDADYTEVHEPEDPVTD